MRFQKDKIAPLWGAASLCGLMIVGCGPKEQVVVTPQDTVIVNNPTPAAGKIVVENQPPEVIVKSEKPAPTKMADAKKTEKTTPEKAPAKMADAPVRAENKVPSGDKLGDKMTKPPTKTATPAKKAVSLPEPASAPKKLMAIPKNATRLIVEDIKVGSGKRAEPGTNVSVEYTGTLTDGTVFDSNAGSGQPFSVVLGAGRVIPGWDSGLVGMKVGGKRRLIIPPDMGYGEQGSPPTIPGGATLVFTVEMKDVQ